MKCPECGHEFKDPAKVAGGKKSKRPLSKEEASRMAKIYWDRRRATETAQEGTNGST